MVGYVNIRGLQGSRYIVEKVGEGFDILLFQETKLADNADFELANYTFPQGAIMSGLAVAYRNQCNLTLELQDTSDFNTDDRQVQLVKVTDPRLNAPVFLANIYIRCDSATRENDWEFLHDLTMHRPNLLVMGDFNARHISWDPSGGNRNGGGLYPALMDLDLYILNSGVPTRLAERHGDPDTVIDLTLATGDIKDRAVWGTGLHMGSDHLLCQVGIKYHLTQPTAAKKKHPYHGCRDTGMWGKLRCIARKKRTPRPTMQRSNAPDWWTAEVDTAWINKQRKDKAFRRLRSNNGPTEEAFVQARIERNLATAQFKKAAATANRSRWDELCERSNLNVTQFWNFLQGLDKRCSAHGMAMFDDDNLPLHTPEEQGRAFLKRYVRQSDHNDDDVRNSLKEQLNSLMSSAQQDVPFTQSEVTSAIRTTKNGAPGPDGIGVDIMKQLKDDEVEQLTQTYNTSWINGEIPETWTDSYIGPVPKPNKDHRFLKGFRIITCQNVIGKVPEKIVARRLAIFIEPLLPSGLGGYRPGRETWVNAAVFAAETWEGFEEKEDTLAVALDLEDAYNRVHLPLLADKMLHLGISVQCVRWVVSALKRRRCILKHRGWKSLWTSIRTGLPQGSPLSPVLFNIYTMQLARLDRPLARVKTFADDILQSSRGKGHQQIQDRAQPSLDRIEQTCNAEGAEINGDKAQALFFTLNNRVKQEDIPSVTYGGTRIELGETLRYLGVVFDRQLNFTEHINSTLLRATKGINALRAAAGRRAEERHLVTLYIALIRSVFDYALPMLQLSQNQVNRVERVQNSCLRVITGCTRSTPVAALHYLVGVTSISARQHQAQAVLISKAMQHKEHGLHQTAMQHRCNAQTTTVCERTLRPRQPRSAPIRRLKRKSWIDVSFQAVESVAGIHPISPVPMWTRPEESSCQQVVVKFNRECREWAEGEAQQAFERLIMELGKADSLIIATDGSFRVEDNRAGWGFAVYQYGEKIADQCGSHSIYTSSTRMEVEAAKRALQWISKNHPEARSIIIATDSMALLSRIQAGWVPDGWTDPQDIPAMGSIIWVYVPGHAGVGINVEADRLAAASTQRMPLQLYSTDINLLATWQNQQATKTLLKNSMEGGRLIEKDIKYGTAATSRRKGPKRCLHNQVLTGNISLTTLHRLLQRGVMSEGICVNMTHLQ